MAVQGPWTFFNIAKPKLFVGADAVQLALGSDAFKVVLATSSQTLSATFTGSSTHARYADLTSELSTSNGYTNGGLTIPSTSFPNLSAGVLTWNCSTMSWTITGGGITFKWAAIYDNTASNKDLVCYTDFDTGGGSVTALSGTLSIPGPIATAA